MSAELEKQYEGCRLMAYPDPGTGGVPWTIGYGHTKGVKQGDTCTQMQADAWLIEDIAWAVRAVSLAERVPLTDNEQEALVDFVFNVGATAFNASTLLRKLNAGDYEGASNEFARWNLAGGKVLSGLVKRRAAETALFKEDIPPCTLPT